jgi:3-oxoacyl-[acyl-carrier-protein] synthase II
VLGEATDRVPVSGTKPYHGHALGASGAIEVAITCLAMERSWIPPTLNLEHPDVECPLAHVEKEGRSASVHVALSNSFGFGGINASLVLRSVPGADGVGAASPEHLV